MKRRDILRGAGLVAAAAGLGACGITDPESKVNQNSNIRFEWKMLTSWPAGFPGLGTGAERLAELITEATGGRIKVKVYASGELVPPFEVFDAVSRGTGEMGHSAAYYWKGKLPSAPFFCSVPFGLNAQEMNAWLYNGGGLELWREAYAAFNLVPFPAGNTGVQMAGWYRKEIRSVSDLKGLKIRMPGLGGDVIARLGAVPVNLPGGEIFTALQTGAIDAAEWVGPYNDRAFGMHRVAKYCYFPGWQEPGATLEAMINKTAWDSLPADLQAIVRICCQAVNDSMLAEYTARNQEALDNLVQEHKVEVRRLPPAVLVALRRAADEVLEEIASADPIARRVYDSVRSFRAQSMAWHSVSEEAFYSARR